MALYFIDTRQTPQHLKQGQVLIQKLFPARFAVKKKRSQRHLLQNLWKHI